MMGLSQRAPSLALSDEELMVKVTAGSVDGFVDDDAQRMQTSLAMLPDAQAEVITLGYHGQLTTTEIATHLGLPVGTVKGRMRLGLQKLRADLKPVPEVKPVPDLQPIAA